MNETAPTAPPWIVAVTIDMSVTLPDGVVVSRDEFHAWLWERADGLLGIDEGIVTAADAAARRLVPSWMVIDTAASPPDRDWIADLAVTDAEWWFANEWSARSAAGLVTDIAGCRIRGVRADEGVDRERPPPFEPITISGFGTVRPSWQEGAAGIDGNGDATIFIEPGIGFGTGLHETTQLCLVALADRRRRTERFDRVLDYGSGSGSLGIAAVVLGAKRVEAIEIDTNVHAALHGNAQRNGVDDRLHLAHDLSGTTDSYDVIVANIVAEVLLEQAIALCGHVSRRGGELVLSGLLAGETSVIAEHFAAILGIHPQHSQRGVWGCLSFRFP
ncbi:MAG: 50S ribosomal protein L11 methyltransferase [Planctomycetaceae bacterium]